MKVLKKCCNGCDAPPYFSLSKVLCKDCFQKLNEKMRALLAARYGILQRVDNNDEEKES